MTSTVGVFGPCFGLKRVRREISASVIESFVAKSARVQAESANSVG